MEIDGQAPEENSQPSEVVALIEQSLVAVRHDQLRRRLPYRGEHGAGPGGFGGPFGGAPWGAGPWGEPPYGRGWRGGHGDHHGHDHDHRRDHDHGQDARRSDDGSGGSDGSDDNGDNGDTRSADDPSPRGRRGRPDGSLGRAARFRMLDALEAAEKAGTELSISALAEAVGVDQPRASRLVQEGVDRGLVRRIQDPSDARRSLIQLTAAGRTQISEVRNHRRSAVEQAIAAFTPEEARTFATLFDRFVRAWPRD